MAVFRQRLRLLSAAWILFQVMSLSTLVPRACCLAHQSASAIPADCHEQTAVPPAPVEHRTAHSMHHDHGQMHEQAPPANPPVHDCAFRGTCGGPTAALLALLATHGVLTDSIVSLTDFPLAGETVASADQLIPQFESPDLPPPRA